MLPFLQYPLRRSNTKQAPSTIRSIRASRDVETINAISVAERNDLILETSITTSRQLLSSAELFYIEASSTSSGHQYQTTL